MLCNLLWKTDYTMLIKLCNENAVGNRILFYNVHSCMNKPYSIKCKKTYTLL